MSTTSVHSTPFASQRRSQRILLSVPIKVSGKRGNTSTFEEMTTTLIVNAHGALILLQQFVSKGDELTIRNVKTEEELQCTVIDVSNSSTNGSEVGVEFSTPSIRFWRVTFPPADWSSRSPEAKRITKGPAIAPKPLKPPNAK